MKDNKHEVSIIRSSVAEYLTFITATGESDVNAVYFDQFIKWHEVKSIFVCKFIFQLY